MEKKLFREVGVVWASSSGRIDWSSEKPSAFGKGKKAQVLWGCWLSAAIWVVWMERNKRIFEAYSGVELEDLWQSLVLGIFMGLCIWGV